MGDLIPHRLLAQAVRQPTAPAYVAKVGGRWQTTTWKAYVDQVRTVARALLALGLPRGGTVAALGFNRPEWVILDHAAMLAGGAIAGIYTTCSRDEVEYIVRHSEAHVVLVENADQLAKLARRKEVLPQLAHVVLMRGASGNGRDVLTWDELVATGERTPETELEARIAALAPDALATLIYTSGTTGPPKAVMLSHANLAWTARTLHDIGGPSDGDVSLSYLPLSHIAEQMATVHVPVTAGSTVYFAESLEAIAANLKDCRPTVFFGVPRIWEKLHGGLAAKLGELTGAKAKLVAWARSVCSRVNALHDRGAPIPRMLAAQYALAQRLVIRKLKTAIGFDRARTLVSGAAPIAPDVLAFFSSLDLPIREIYGQSEDCGPTSYNLPGRTRLGTVGPPIPGIACKLGDDGEILIRGPNVFMGYLKDAAATAETLRDGWLCSGDLGAFDADGFLTITGRKKEIIITSGGKNIAPKNIEAALKQSPLVGEAVVIGDRRKFLTALLVLDEPSARKVVDLADLDALARAPELRRALQRVVDEVNASVARVEQVKRFAILARPFAIETGELTPTLKIKRSVVAERYAREIEALYADDPAPL